MKKMLLPIAMTILLYAVFIASASSTHNKPNIRVGVVGTSYSSLNWAGYAMHSSTYTSVNGNWIVPSVSTASSGYSSAWVGVGGFSGSTVIQVGTEQDCLSGSVTGERYHGINNAAADNSQDASRLTDSSKRGGSKTTCNPTYYTWWELYPQNAEQKITTITISPGDSISASVTRNANGSWTLTINDTTNGRSFSTTQTPSFTPDQTSAEAIVERPALCTAFSCKLTNLADFGKINLASVAGGTTQFSSSNSDPITMVDNAGQTLAQPSSISTPGTFSVQWFRSS